MSAISALAAAGSDKFPESFAVPPAFPYFAAWCRDQEKIPDIDPNLHAVGISFAVVGGLNELHIRLIRCIHISQCNAPVGVRAKSRRRPSLVRDGAPPTLDNPRVRARFPYGHCCRRESARRNIRATLVRSAVRPGSAIGFDEETVTGVDEVIIHRDLGAEHALLTVLLVVPSNVPGKGVAAVGAAKVPVNGWSDWRRKC